MLITTILPMIPINMFSGRKKKPTRHSYYASNIVQSPFHVVIQDLHNPLKRGSLLLPSSYRWGHFSTETLHSRHLTLGSPSLGALPLRTMLCSSPFGTISERALRGTQTLPTLYLRPSTCDFMCSIQQYYKGCIFTCFADEDTRTRGMLNDWSMVT